jgi:hypothetical protein
MPAENGRGGDDHRVTWGPADLRGVGTVSVDVGLAGIAVGANAVSIADGEGRRPSCGGGGDAAAGADDRRSDGQC